MPGCSTNSGPGHADDIPTKGKAGVPGSIGDSTTDDGCLRQVRSSCTKRAIPASAAIPKSGATEAPLMATGCIGQPEVEDTLRSQPVLRCCSNDNRANVPSVVSI